MVSRMAFAALLETAGLKLMKNFPFFAFELLLHADRDRLWRGGVVAAWLLIGLTFHAWW